MTLLTIVRALGGDLYDGGRRASVPGPGHGAGDRSVSLVLREDRILVHSFGRSTWLEVLDDLRRRGLVDVQGRTTEALAPAQPATLASLGDRSRCAARIWNEARPLGRSLAFAHVRRRAVTRRSPVSASLRFQEALPSAVYANKGRRRPALLAALRTPADDLCGVEVTYLSADGDRARDLPVSRKIIGVVPPASAVRLDAQGPELLVGEGVFTTLSAAERFQLPGWALLSAHNLERWDAPIGVDRILIAADRGAAGEAAARRLAQRLITKGRRVSIEIPPASFGDWNEAAVRGPCPGGGSHSQGARSRC